MYPYFPIREIPIPVELQNTSKAEQVIQFIRTMPEYPQAEAFASQVEGYHQAMYNDSKIYESTALCALHGLADQQTRDNDLLQRVLEAATDDLANTPGNLNRWISLEYDERGRRIRNVFFIFPCGSTIRFRSLSIEGDTQGEGFTKCTFVTINARN
jgi:hypothetical protein